MLPERLGRTARVLSTATELTPNGYQQTRLEGDLDHPAHPLFGVSHFGPCGWINCAIRVFQGSFFFGIFQLSTKQNFAHRLTSLGKQPRRYINSSVV